MTTTTTRSSSTADAPSPATRNFAETVVGSTKRSSYIRNGASRLAFTDAQLARVFAAADGIPVTQRGAWLRALAGRLGGEPTDDELCQAVDLVQDDVRG